MTIMEIDVNYIQKAKLHHKLNFILLNKNRHTKINQSVNSLKYLGYEHYTHRLE